MLRVSRLLLLPIAIAFLTPLNFLTAFYPLIMLLAADLMGLLTEIGS